MYPNDRKWKKRIDNIELLLDYELDNLIRCEGCYIKYYDNDDDEVFDQGFNLPCATPHALVWHKRDEKWWPAKAFEYRPKGTFNLQTDTVEVIEFGKINQEERRKV